MRKNNHLMIFIEVSTFGQTYCGNLLCRANYEGNPIPGRISSHLERIERPNWLDLRTFVYFKHDASIHLD